MGNCPDTFKINTRRWEFTSLLNLALPSSPFCSLHLRTISGSWMNSTLKTIPVNKRKCIWFMNTDWMKFICPNETNSWRQKLHSFILFAERRFYFSLVSFLKMMVFYIPSMQKRLVKLDSMQRIGLLALLYSVDDFLYFQSLACFL